MTTLTVTPLGISAGTPTRDRNVASMFVQRGGNSLLLDCGEGTQHQLIRLGWKPNSIDAILITHLHGDHLFGLPGLLSTMSMMNRTRPLTVVGPAGIARYLEGIASSSQLNLGYALEVADVGDGVVYRSEVFTVEALFLDHCIPCLGFRISEVDRPGRFDVRKALELGIPDGPLFGALQRGESITLADGRVVEAENVVGPRRRGRRVVYTTDTRICDAAVQLARIADLLIHEATYGDEMETEAAERFHATARQAAQVALKAGARRLLLTHFSPRYEDPEELVREARSVFPGTTAARELESIEIAPID
jgi:ribonuclease Z